MLSELLVKDFAIVGEAELEFAPGLTVISGETGAGKSLLVDALALVCGGRGDAGLVRSGAARAEVTALFRPPPEHPARQWLAALALEDGEEIVLRRILASDGGGRALINGRPVTVAQLRELGGLLVAIHGQHQQQRLLERDFQLFLLDRIGKLGEDAALVAALARDWRSRTARLAELRAGAGGDTAERIRLLEHDLAELEREAPGADAYAELEAEQRRLAHAGELLAGLAELQGALHDDEQGLVRRLARARALASRMSRLDPLLAELEARLEEAGRLLAETRHPLASARERLDLDPARLAEVEGRLARLHALARKHRIRESELASHAERLRAELEALGAGEARIRAIEAEREDLARRWREHAARLSARRAEAARALSERVEAVLKTLSMPHARFEVALETTPGSEPDPLGGERAEFLFSANPGEAPRPLRRIASGGELARVALAIEVTALDADPVPTMIFDEVDAGIGGAVAEVLGGLLRRLGARRQVLCVTHLAQVASHGHHHLRANKKVVGGRVATSFEPLGELERVEEIARMLDGAQVGEESLALARRLLRQAAA
jgi:DNA repair protein RecN (Recombination protein N)